ncbi:TPA: hypothetical protein LNF46_003314 [Vibrio cholerae]|nr:hypothetical protein [Vibrio cholerae]HBK7271725.1 hypothetical protein [Vibrio cholerae]HBK7293930.1 hypothetical protein [Vibrio cholerae]HBK7297381.1 hypothetical protein [Vibrio cholerae]
MDGPWSQGPKELLQHAVDHISLDGDFDRRIAMISIDNAVELMIKTYLGLPKRKEKSKKPSRKQLEEASNSFPLMLDLIEEFAGQKLTGVSLDEIEWYHRIRNQLYHSGNGITVELAKVQTYLSLAKTLFQNLFETELVLISESQIQKKLGLFLGMWGVFEKELAEKAKSLGLADHRAGAVLFYKADDSTKQLWAETKQFRNIAVHKLETLSADDFTQPIQNISILRDRVENYT